MNNKRIFHRVINLGCILGLLIGLMSLQVVISFETEKMNDFSPVIEWETTIGGPDDDQAHSVIETADGGFLLAGNTNSYGAGDYDVWLVKTNANGEVTWNKTFGGSEGDSAAEVIQVADGGYVLVGNTNSYGAGGSDVWLVKTDTSGQELWNQTFGGAGDEKAGLNSLIQTSDGGYALVGRTDSYGAGDYDFWLVKTDATGQAEWNQTFGGVNWDEGSSLVQAVDGGYALLGMIQPYGATKPNFWVIKTDTTGQAEWNQTFAPVEGRWSWGHSITRTTDGGYALAGFTNSIIDGYGGPELWLLKIDASGDLIWDHNLGVGFALDMIQTADDGYALVGAGAFTKTDVSGLVEWNYTFDDVSNTFSVIQTVDGKYAVVGVTTASAGRGRDMWFIKIAAPVPVPTTSSSTSTTSSISTTTAAGGLGFELEVFVFSLVLIFFFSRKRRP